mmetsp:Transcript_3038/g.6694  ORF Transcript_3038/g.6694 Transcript_3038/m.6694 type:complete len:110 (+) Transcript_3038:2785-3114(+)
MTTYGDELNTPTFSPGTATKRLMNCFPFVDTNGTFSSAATRPTFEFAIASSNSGGGLKNTTSPTLGGRMERVTITTSPWHQCRLHTLRRNDNYSQHCCCDGGSNQIRPC